MKVKQGTALDVTLNWDSDDVQVVGKLAFRDRVAYLEYDPAFVQSGVQISPVYDIAEAGLLSPFEKHVFEGMFGVFNDSLPDGWGRLLVDRRARQLGIDPASLTPLDRLAYVGRDGVGALCYAPVEEIWTPQDCDLDLDKLAQDSQQVLQGEAGEVLDELGKLGGSPGGARPKALIGLNTDDEAVHGITDLPDDYDHYLIKFRGQDDPDDIAAIEMVYAEMAERAGITMPETRLITSPTGNRYFASKRFDRVGSKRNHVMTAAGLLYADFRVPSLDYEDLLRLTRHLTRDQTQCTMMFRLAAFNVLAHNRDDHLKQFSFLLPRNQEWSMAPAYDLTFSSGPGGEHSTSVLGSGKNIKKTELIKLGEKAGLTAKDASDVIAHVQHAIGQWLELAKKYDVSAGSISDVSAGLQRAALT